MKKNYKTNKKEFIVTLENSYQARYCFSGLINLRILGVFLCLYWSMIITMTSMRMVKSPIMYNLSVPTVFSMFMAVVFMDFTFSSCHNILSPINTVNSMRFDLKFLKTYVNIAHLKSTIPSRCNL